MTEIKIAGANRTYNYAADNQGEYGSLLLTADELEVENPDEPERRLKALAEEFEDMIFPGSLDQLL